MYNLFMKGTSASLSPESFNNFGELLKYLRERAELSQRELALQVGYHYSYMSRIEKNERMPDSATLMARFIPALGLEDEPKWTERLLKLAASEEKTMVPRKAAQVALTQPKADSALPVFESPFNPLPLSLTPLLGREREVATVSRILSRPDVRIVTLVGPPGVGKTRLAIHVANDVAGMFAQGAAFADLSVVSDPNDLLSTLATSLGIPETAGSSVITRLISTLRQKNILLVIDNFEHMLDTAAQLVQVLSNAPQVKMLVTSREALRISGEHEFTVAPLSLPQKDENNPTALGSSQLMDYAAIQLFAQRAQAVDNDFHLTLENLSAIAEVCRRLDGLPLAIELAAARSKLLTPQAMLAQLDRRLDWVAHGTRDSSIASRQSLRGAIEWSHALLSDTERILMRRLSVFSGGWTSTSAEAICGESDADSDRSLRRADVLDILIQLVDKSLVITEKQESETRFRFLETIHEFARKKLKDDGEEVTVKNRHLAYFADLAEEVERHLEGDDQVKWTHIGDQEHNNIRAALDWGLCNGASLQDGLRLVSSISLFWVARSYFHEGFAVATKYLSHASEPEQRLFRAKILYRAGAMASFMFDYANAIRLCQQSIELSRALGNKHYLANGLFYLSQILVALGQNREARAALEESISLCWDENYLQQLSISLAGLAWILYEGGDYEGAKSTLGEALAIATRADDTWGMSHALHSLGAIHRYNKDYDEAIRYMERSYDVSAKIGNRQAQATTLTNLSIFYNLKDEYAKSEQYAERAFALYQSMGAEPYLPFVMRMMGYAAIHAGNFVRARVLIQESLRGNRSLEDVSGQLASVAATARCSFAEKDIKKAVALGALIETHITTDGVKLLEPDSKALQEVLVQGRKKLGKSAYEAAYAEGTTLSLDDQIMRLMIE